MVFIKPGTSCIKIKVISEKSKAYLGYFIIVLTPKFF